MTLSIIIVSFNTKKLTLGCIKSISKEGSNLTKEVIVVDNGSKDSSPEAVESYSCKLTLKLIRNRTNLGFAKANNQGIKQAKGRYVLLLNSDTKVKKGALRKLVEFAEKTPNAGVVGARLLNPDGSVQPSCLRFPTIKNAIAEYWFGKKGLFDKYAPKGKKPRQVDAIVGAAFLITPQARKEIGLLDERYFMFYEDIDYCRRVKRATLAVYYLPAAEIIHQHGASGKELADEASQWRRLIPSSKIYHGLSKHYLLTAILWSGQKWQKVAAKK